MFDPIRAYYASDHNSTQYENLDEEHFAQRYGHVVAEYPIWNLIWLRVGDLLIGFGEKLKAENAPIKWEKETV